MTRRYKTIRRWLPVVIALLVGVYLGGLLLMHPFSASTNTHQMMTDGIASSTTPFAEMLEQSRRQKLFRSTVNSNIRRTEKQGGTNNNHDDDLRHAVCRQLSPTTTLTPTATAVWMESLSRIHKASQLKRDKRYHFHDFFAQLLYVVSPRLPLSTNALPHDWRTVRRILDKAWKRWEYIQQTNSGANPKAPPPPPVRIVVLGGSVLVGRNCRKLCAELGLPWCMPNRECNFAHRLDEFLNAVLLGTSSYKVPLVKVIKIAMGGTNTATGSTIFHYNLIPEEEAGDPDIVVNAYATNDMHILTVLEAMRGNQTLRGKVLEMTQNFVRDVWKPQPSASSSSSSSCPNNHHPPLILHLNDYLGNEQREIMATTELEQSVTTLAHYYGFASMSYSNMVRQLVYYDTHETWFSPSGWWPSTTTDPKGHKIRSNGGSRRETMEREIHPNMGAHVTIMWMVAYNLLHIVTTFCSLQPLYYTPSITGHNDNDGLEEYSQLQRQVIPLTDRFSQIPGKPRRPPENVLPPELTPTLSLETVSQDWQRAVESAGGVGSVSDHEENGQDCQESYSQCIFSWVSGLSLQQNNKTWIEQTFGAHWDTSSSSSTNHKQWKLSDDGGKLGWVPRKGLSDSMTLDFLRLRQPISVVTFFILKSYGEKWAKSKLQVEMLGRRDESSDSWQELAVDHLLGFHDKNTSEMYTEEVLLPKPAPAGSSLRIHCTLEAGTTFKIMGLAVCS